MRGIGGFAFSAPSRARLFLGLRQAMLPFAALLLCPCVAPAQEPKPIQVPRAGDSYVDPLSGNRVWRVTDSRLCPKAAKHVYSSWPVWNADGSYLLIQCNGAKDSALLVRNDDLRPAGDALRGAPPLNAARLFWSWTSPHLLYGFRGKEVWEWDPFSHKGRRVFQWGGERVGDLPIRFVRLAYVSLDGRYLLIELQGPNPAKRRSNQWQVLGLATYDIEQRRLLGVLDMTAWPFYDEAVFTKGNRVWVVTDRDSFSYELDFSKRVRVSEAGHHAHGMLLSGKAVSIKAASNRDCPAGSPSGNPNDKEYPAKGWKPTAVLLDDLVDSPAEKRSDPLPSILFKLGCQVPGQHHFAHFSWNNSQGDSFFVSTESYSAFDTDPLAQGLLRVRLRFDSNGAVVADQFDLLAHHRSDPKGNYWAQPRMSCNQQGTRCLFSSNMTVNADQPRGRPDLYIVEVPPPK